MSAHNREEIEAIQVVVDRVSAQDVSRLARAIEDEHGAGYLRS